MKTNIIYSFIAVSALLLSSCLESDEFDGLTDSRPDIAVDFPGRTFDQEVGLGFIATGYAGNPSITYTMELNGGSAEIESIMMVEGRAVNVNLGTCNYAVIEDDEIAVNDRSFNYVRSLEFLQGSEAFCSATLDIPDTYFELIFTIQLTNGEQIVTMPVRGLFKE